ncbi:ATP-binding protein [Streptomyces sp. NRRL S-31]|uniref:ATP-binding protein n=1 Tax=Streptomyces sp. NRRL S-31 TaxID=1463898 RepID=UPI0004C6BE8A|nr:ATP-binding protein [Streptomyces sp. NRRL S-31]
MRQGSAVHELITIALHEGSDVVILRRCTQSVCRATGLTGSPLVRLTTVVSEAGEHLLGASGLTARLSLEVTDVVRVTVRFGWREVRRPASALLSAATRLLDAARLLSPGDGGPHELLLAQRTPAPVSSAGELAVQARVKLTGAGTAADLIDALRTQNHQLLTALEESQRQQEELQRLNAELEETNAGVMALYSELTSELQATNSGVVALYAELEEKTRQLELAHEYKTRFWANVSHELRSPVNSVIALARLLDSGTDPLTEEQRRQVALVQASGSTLLALVDELLDVAKAESGRLEPHFAEVDLRALLYQLRGTLQGTTQPGVRLRIPEGVGLGLLVTDEVMLTRVLRNVLSNALKFTVEGSVTLDITEASDEGGSRFVFRVQDTGVGIAAEELDRVFEEFYQVRGPHQRGRAGTGLGLPYARRLTELLGGRLTLDSEIGRGTGVTVEIPASADRPAAETGHAAATGRARPVAGSVVVVDDDEAFVAAVRPLLDEVAGSVTFLGDGAHAVATVERERPDAVLLDLNMPGVDGYEVYRLLAAHPATARTPVVVLTALDVADVDRSRLARVRAVLNKSRLTAADLAGALSGSAAPAATQPPAADPPLPATVPPHRADPLSSTAEERR